MGGECYGYGFDKKGAGDFWKDGVGKFLFSSLVLNLVRPLRLLMDIGATSDAQR